MREAERPVLDPDPTVRTDQATKRRTPSIGPSPWKKAALIVVVTHLAFFALAWAASYYLSGAQGPPQEGFTDLWRRWDTEHFVDIAEHGYSSPETDQYAEAFFPLYPLSIRALTVLPLSPVVAGMLLSALASIVALAYLFKLAEEDLYPGAGRRASMYLALFPTAVFLAAAYSESLFLAGAIPAFYYARRGQWRFVGIPAAVAMGTRFAGAFLLAGLVVEFIRQRDFDRRRVLQAVLSGAIAVVPLVAYMGYLWAANDGPFQFVTAQRENPFWSRTLTNPIETFTTTWNTYNGDYASTWLLAWRVEIAAAVAGLFFTGWAFRRGEYGYGTYMALTLLPLLVSSWYLSIPRILLSLFPIPLLVASVTRNERTHDLVLGVSALFAALGVIVFTRGQWFF